ncbi:serine/threonine-protein kinase [Actinomadura rupiterrae]|uniref:serine/threonine-protein kinase n=1 Tax=Actinomadura rupiterrae TaxID=559627 RepID=UPI0020A49BFC|nr:serine/threonine-protein kinase [Actinomadura rupiterrae]MCP2336395.1 serine/threonine protein kinase [Actinomadura rupiterrae]
MSTTSEDVPGYQVLEQVGEGGFSVVYRARQDTVDRQVALKVLSLGTVDDDAMRRFQRECRITGRLSDHPNVVTVLDTGLTGAGRPYIAMEYFEHGSLADRLGREGPLPVPDVLRIGVKMAGALAATHEADVLHRDVKPQNILVSRYGEPALADFGIARLVDNQDASHTQAFTPHHAAPEVLEGRQPGPASDIYSLGSTLYQLLAGKPAFRGPAGEGIAQLMMRILNEPPPPIQRADVPPPVQRVIAQSMAKIPEQRFGSAVEFARAFQAVQRDLGLPVTDIAHSDALQDLAAQSGEGFPGLPTHPRPPAVPEWAPTAPGRLPDAASQPGTPGMPAAPVPPHTAPPGAAPAPAWPPSGPEASTLGHTAGEPRRDGPRRGLLIAAAVALVGGTAAGIGALVLASGGGDGSGPSPKRSAGTTAGEGVQGNQPDGNTPMPLSKELFRTTRPQNVKVKPGGRTALLAWTLPPNAANLPIIVQRQPFGRSQVITAGTNARSVTVPGLDPKGTYCLRVGAVLRVNQNGPADVSWSKPVCVHDNRAKD